MSATEPITDRTPMTAEDVSAFPDIGGMSAYPDFSLVEVDFPQWEAGTPAAHSGS